MIKLYSINPELMVISPGDITVRITPNSKESFKELIQRGANLWPDAPPEIKEFADLVTTGQVLQDYHAQSKKPSK